MKKFRPSKAARDYLGHRVVGAAHAHVTQGGNFKFKVSYNPPKTQTTSPAKNMTNEPANSEVHTMFADSITEDDLNNSDIPLRKVIILFCCQSLY
jgi:hypothetical protein